MEYLEKLYYSFEKQIEPYPSWVKGFLMLFVVLPIYLLLFPFMLVFGLIQATPFLFWQLPKSMYQARAQEKAYIGKMREQERVTNWAEVQNRLRNNEGALLVELHLKPKKRMLGWWIDTLDVTVELPTFKSTVDDFDVVADYIVEAESVHERFMKSFGEAVEQAELLLDLPKQGLELVDVPQDRIFVCHYLTRDELTGKSIV